MSVNVTAIAINCSLKKSGGEKSSTDAMLDVLGSQFEKAGVELAERLRIADDAQIVLEDLVLPNVLLPPFPLHGTLGIRRSLDPGEPLTDAGLVGPGLADRLAPGQVLTIAQVAPATTVLVRPGDVVDVVAGRMTANDMMDDILARETKSETE